MKMLKDKFKVKDKIDFITKMVFIYVLLQPFLDILSFLNIRGYIPGISTIVKPLFVFALGTYIFITDKSSRKKYFIIYALFFILLIAHNLILFDLMISKSVIFHEIRFMINFAYMMVLFMIFEYLYVQNSDKEWFIDTLKKVIVVTFFIYTISILLAIITGTSAKTYEYADKTKAGLKGWLDSGQIFGHALCITLPFMIHYLFNNSNKNKILDIISSISIVLPIAVLLVIGTKVTYYLAIIILFSHVVLDFIFGLKDKNKILIIQSIFCLILMVGTIGVYKYTPVKKNSDINRAVLSVDMSKTSKGTETNRNDLASMKNNIDGNSEGTWWTRQRVKRLSKYYEWDLKASYELEKRYVTGKLHPNDMRNRQLIYNSYKYLYSSWQYKLFGIGYLNQEGLLSLERDCLMMFFSFGIFGLFTVLIKPILIWFKATKKILKNFTKTKLETLYLFEGFSIFFCISVYAGYTFIYTNFSIYLVIIGLLLLDSLKDKNEPIFSKYFEKIYNKGRKEFFTELEENVKNNKKEFIITANPETLMTSEKDEELRKAVLDNETIVIPDGVGILKGAKKLEYDIYETILGVDVAQNLLELADKYKKKIYLFGAKNEVIEKMKELIKEKYSNAEIVGAVDGYVEDRQTIIEDMKKQKPNIVLVALGIPEQEKLIYKNLKEFDKGIFVGVGGSFDVLSGMKKRAPKIFIKLKLEWLYRITVEPKRLKRFYQSNIKYWFKVNDEKVL